MKLSAKYLSIGMIILSLISCNKNKKASEKVIEITPEKIELLVGTYTDKESKGIYKMFFNPIDGSLENIGLVAEAVSPSYFTISKNKRYVYSVNESDPGNVSSFKWNADRTKLNLVNKLSSEGKHPCYVELNSDDSLFATANYSSGNISVYKIDREGHIQENPQTRQHTGSSIKPNQKVPHAHCVKFSKNSNFLYVVDLGIDEIATYSVEDNGRLGDKQIALKLDAGDGPRHIAYHPTKNNVFIINKMSSSVISAKVNATTGKFEVIDKESTLPDDYTGKNSCEDIQITSNGKFLYASNRGHNTISIFSISENGNLERLATTSVEGDWPRNFTLSPDEKLLLVANQNTTQVI